MDPLIASGVFIAGVGVGISVFSRGSEGKANPVVCHCEYTGDKATASGSNSWKELILVLLLGIFVGGSLIVGIRFWLTHQEVVPLSKGKGKKGVYGNFSPLAISG